MGYKNKQDHLEYNRLYRERNRVLLREKDKQKRRKYKELVLNYYGKMCAHCNFTDYRALQIDHIADNGAQERVSLGGKQMSGWRFYEYLVKNNFPIGYQTLCANCNNIKQWNKNNLD